MIQYCLSAIPSLDKKLKHAQRILIAADFDGTLCPISDSPSEVRVAPYMLEILRTMAASTRVKLAVISGRALDDLSKRLSLDVVLAGNHGLEMRGGGLQFENEDARHLRPVVNRTCMLLEEVVSSWPGAWVENKGLSATVHYRGVIAAQQHSLKCAVRKHIAGRIPDLGLRSAKRALELYPKVQWGKGEALRYIEANGGPFDLRICIGDDATDEDMFIDDPAQINIKVGPSRPTRARFHFCEPTEVAIFLEHVLSVCDMPRTGPPEIMAEAVIVG